MAQNIICFNVNTDIVKEEDFKNLVSDCQIKLMVSKKKKVSKGETYYEALKILKEKLS